MRQTNISLLKQNYLLTKIFFFAGIGIVIITLIMAILNYHNYVRLRVAGYEEILNVLESTYVYELVKENEQQHSVLISLLDKDAIQRGESVYNSSWSIAHKIKMEEDHYIYFYNAINGNIDSYPYWERGDDFDPTTRPWYTVIQQEHNNPMWVGPYEEYNSQDLVLSLGQKVIADNGDVLGVMLVDMSLESLGKVLKRMSSSLDISVFIRDRHSHEMLSVVNQELLKIDRLKSGQNYGSFHGLIDGALFIKELTYVDWDIGIYVPSSRFRKALLTQLIILILPVGAFCVVVAMGIRSLVKIFRQELMLVEMEIEQLNNATINRNSIDSAWFVDHSLDKIKSQCANQRLKLRQDPLTGIGNRLVFDEDMKQWALGIQSYALVLIDVDKFKLINDNFGHQFGDSVLRRVAEALALIFGRERVYRFGGDEFACLLAVNEQTELINHLEHLLEYIRQQHWREKACKVTLSIGVAFGPKEPKQLFEAADTALYHSKNAGRDCWHIG